MRTATLLLLLLLPVFALATDLGKSLTFSELEGRWVGQYRIGTSTTFIVLVFTNESGRWSATYNRPSIDWEESHDLRSIALQERSLRFQIGGDAPSPFVDTNPDLRLQLTLQDDVLEGSVLLGLETGTVRLVHLASLEKDYLDSLAGDYRLPDGSLLVIERENRYLCFLEEKTNKTGRLMPRSKAEFWSGPTLDTWYPPEWEFRFNGGGDGMRTVEVKRPGAALEIAKQVHLYKKEDVTFANGEVLLSGTLRLPLSERPAPSVVILHGSNYQTRGGQYASLGFVADEFARNGFAVLSYDKRGTGKSGGKREDTTGLLAGDAAAAIQLLRRRSEVDPAQVGLWGISQGGMLQPAVAAQVPDLAFFINVSGAAQNGNEQEIQRTELKMRADGFSEEDISAAVALQKAKFRYACKRDNWDDYIAALNTARNRKWFLDPYIGPPDTKESTAWDFWGCGGEGPPGFKRLHAPYLYIFAEYEAYSRPDLNLKALQQWLGPNAKLTVHEFKGAEHSMFAANNGGEKELMFTNHYADGYFEFLVSWSRSALASSRGSPN